MGDLRFTSMARTPKSSTWMDAPAAYQKGPEIPKFHATLDDWRRVAAHVHCDTMTCAGWGSAVTRSGRTLGAGAGIEAGIGAGGAVLRVLGLGATDGGGIGAEG